MKTARDNAEKIKEISGANPQKCMKCGKCSATCPAFNEMDIKPHQFVSYVAEENIDARETPYQAVVSLPEGYRANYTLIEASGKCVQKI